MLISDLADADENIAFAAFYGFVAPAMWQRMAGDLRRVLHGGTSCGQTRPAGLPGRDDGDLAVCPACQAAVDDRLCEVFARLRAALGGDVPVTRASPGSVSIGMPAVEVGEWRLVVDHVYSAQADAEDVAACAAALLDLPMDRPSPDHPAWLRAAKAQLVLFPNEHLRAELRRREAVAAGRAARPDRDVRTAAWAAPLRTDPVSLALLTCFLRRLHAGTATARAVPDDVLAEHGLTPTAAAQRLEEILARLRRANPGFYARNIAEPLARHDTDGGDHRIPGPGGGRRRPGGGGRGPAPSSLGADDLAAAAEEGARCRAEILAAVDVADQAAHPRSRAGRPPVRTALAGLVDLGYGRDTDVTAACVRRGLDPAAAAELVARLAGLVAGAGVGWVDLLLHTLDARTRAV